MQASCAARSRPAQLPPISSRPIECASLVEDERQWRAAEIAPSTPWSSGPGRVIATRWRSIGERTQEFTAGAKDDYHVLALALRGMDMRLLVSGRTVHDGVATSGTFHLTAAGDPARCLFRGSYDMLHLYLSTSLVKALTEEAPAAMAMLASGDALSRDPIVESLGRSLVQADAGGDDLSSLFADSVGAALAARLLALSQVAAAVQRSRAGGLVRWRLKRALDYIESRLEEPVRLADLASATGLTRMHFAAQFRAATGLRPHEYLLRRRIDRAKERLAGTGMSVLEVALSVGFQSPSHFTTVFKRFTGEPPCAWRQSQRAY